MMSESYRTRAAKLAAAARALQALSGRRRAAPFSLAFLTDRRRAEHPELVARTLPAGAALIYRDYDDPRRAAHGAKLRAIVAGRGVLFLVGGDAGLARRLGADGVHLRADDLWRAKAGGFGGLCVSAACHTAEDLAHAASIGVDIALLSPVYPTRSHPGATTLAPEAFKRLAAAAALPVLALGGVEESNAGRLAGPNVCGLAAIDAFAPRR